MDTPTPPPGTGQPQPVTPEAFAALVKQYQRLEKLLIFALLGLIVVVFSMNIYFSRVAKGYREQCANLERKVSDDIKTTPLIREFATAMQQYAATDKDFAPIWERYRPAFTNYLGLLKGGSTAAPKAVAPKK